MIFAAKIKKKPQSAHATISFETISKQIETWTHRGLRLIIVAGGSPRITIDGDTRNPVTIITEKQTYPNVQLPYTVQVNRHHIDGQRIQIQSENASYRDVVLEKKVNNWTFGNILIGGLIGFGVDLISNCVAKPSKPNYFIEKRAEE